MTKKIMLPAVVVSWILATLARLGWHGDVYGFNFAIFQPDGIYYAYKTLMLLGSDSYEGARQVSSWFSNYSGTGSTYNPDYFLSTWSTYPSERILYPLLSMPFVALLGLNGMLVIPIISLLVLQINIYFLGKRLGQQYLGLGLAIVVSFSPTVTRWMISSTSDSLLVAILSFVPILMIISKIKYLELILFVLIVASSLTRFSLSIFFFMGLIFVLHKRFKIALIVFASSAIFAVPALMQINTGFMPRNNGGIIEKLLDLPITFVKVGFIEVAQLAVMDRLLLLIVLTALFLALRFNKSISSYFFLAILAAVWILGALNGSLGVNFRYQLPLLIFCCWTIFESLPRLFVVSNTHIKVKEIQEKL